MSNEKHQEINDADEARLIRKITWAAIPLLNMTQAVQEVDKTTLNHSAMLGLFRDTGITIEQFGWIAAMFYVGYLIVQIPNSLALQRFHTSKYLGTILMGLGLVVGCNALCQTYAQLVGLRILLGAFAAAVYPCIFLLISTLYRRSEQVIWFSSIYITDAIAVIVNSLIMYSLGYIDDTAGVSAWQWGMILWGAITMLLGLVCFVFLPDKPTSRWFRLSPIEKKIVEERIRDNTVVQTRTFKWTHVREAISEPRFYCYLVICVCFNLLNGCFTVFQSQVISEMGFKDLDAILLNIPSYAADIVAMATAAWMSRKYSEISYLASLFQLLPFGGIILLLMLPAGGVQLAGLYLTFCNGPIYSFLSTSVSNNVTGYTKKIFYNASLVIAYSVGNFVGPLLILDRERPRYPSAMVTYATATLLTSILFLYIRWDIVRRNQRREELRRTSGLTLPPENREELDLTDKEDLYFVYLP